MHKAVTATIAALFATFAHAASPSPVPTPPAANTPAAASPWTLAAALLRLPFGLSQWEIALATPAVVSPLQVLRQVTPACDNISANIDVLDLSGAWVGTSFENGFFLTPAAPVSRVRITFSQQTRTFQDCQLTVTSFADPAGGTPPSPVKGRRTLAGTLDFKGGVAAHTAVGLSVPFYADTFEIEVPATCPEVHLLDGGIRRGDAYRQAYVANDCKLQFHLPEAQAFSTIDLSVSGPVGAACQLPIYVYDLAADSPGAPTAATPLAADARLNSVEFYPLGAAN